MLSSDLLLQLLCLLESADIAMLCATSRTRREHLKFLHTFAVKFRREVLLEEAAVDSLQRMLVKLKLHSFTLCLPYQSNLQRSICGLADVTSMQRLTDLTLDLRRCGLGDTGVQAWAKALAEQKLQKLDLRLSFNKISSRGADALSASLGLSLVQVFLHMDINLIGRSAPKLLSAILQARQARIDLAHCGLGDEVAVDLAEILESHASFSTKPQKIHIDLRGNNLAETKARIIKATSCLNAAFCKCIIHLD